LFDFCVIPSPPPQRLNFKEICTVGLVEHVSEGKIEEKIQVTERRGRRRKQMLDDLGGNEGVLRIEGGGTGLHNGVRWLRRRLCNRRRAGHVTNEWRVCSEMMHVTRKPTIQLRIGVLYSLQAKNIYTQE
jgi:hypothetical protein